MKLWDPVARISDLASRRVVPPGEQRANHKPEVYDSCTSCTFWFSEETCQSLPYDEEIGFDTEFIPQSIERSGQTR